MTTTTSRAPDAREPPERGRIGRTEWLLLGVTTFLSLAALELFLRLWFPLYASPYQPDDVVLVRLVPGARKVFTRFAMNGGQRIISQINSQGFRGEELRPLRDTVATRSVPLLLVILPAAIDACDHYELQVNSREYPQYDRARLSALVEQIAARNGILHLNLWDAFHGDGVCYYFHGGDGHWNDAGQAKAAQLLSDLIVRRGLLAGPTPP